MFEYKREMPTITADIICWDYVLNEFKFLFIKRKKDPGKGMWALPGGHFEVKTDEKIIDTAYRELQEETGLVAKNLSFLNYYDLPGRDPRGRYIGFVFHGTVDFNSKVVANDDAVDYCWMNISEINESNIAFDHKNMIAEFMGISNFVLALKSRKLI